MTSRTLGPTAEGDRPRPPHPHAAETRRDRMHRVLHEVTDRIAASDPGLGRLRTAASAAISVGTALPVQLAVAKVAGLTGQSAFATALFGAVVAMLGSNALTGWNRWAKARTAAFFPLCVTIGLVLALLTEAEHLLQVVGFAVVLFLAVWVRRFGPAFFFYGFMGFMGFFFATFLHATWALVPNLVVAAVVSTAWVLLLNVTVFSTNPRRSLEATRSAFYARARAVARESADLLALPPGAAGVPRARRTVAARRAALSETALMAEAWSAETDAVPPGWSAPALRRRLIEAQQAAERFASASLGLHGGDPALVAEARDVLDDLATRRDVSALLGADRLRAHSHEVEAADGPGWWSARYLAVGVREFLRFDAATDEPPELDPGEAEFEAATTFVNGNLPGSPAVARDVAPRGHGPLARFSLSTRQAVQVALAGVVAVLLGTALSPARYYWAVIATFVVFTGTSSRSETFRKGFARIVGTVLGLVAAIALAGVTAGHKPAVITLILVSIFLAFYFVKLSYTAMTFFVTVLLGQLYTVLGTFSDALLALRLEETAIGAATGTVVALLVSPLSTRDTVRSARDTMLTAMTEFLDEVVRYAVSEGQAASSGPRLDARVRTLDDGARRLALVTRPLTRPLVWGNSSPRTRRRLSLYIVAVSQCRALGLDLQRHDLASARAVADAARAIGEAVTALAARPPGDAVPEAERPLVDGATAIFADPDAAYAQDPVIRHLWHLGSTIAQIARTPNVPDAPRHRA